MKLVAILDDNNEIDIVTYNEPPHKILIDHDMNNIMNNGIMLNGDNTNKSSYFKIGGDYKKWDLEMIYIPASKIKYIILTK